ncbi:SDR family NAD(P)-dependent oxidoreductase (plasmid) [Vibrio tubiashii]|uniref:SDR family NAD(P)-dependent oxidoreductase n=1 Tax=Vibrio tubiashii TaxID=29498 RepID=UPI003CE554DB
MSKRVMLISGGNRGIGKAIGYGLKAKEYHLALTYRKNQEQAEEIRRTLSQAHKSRVSIHQLDVSCPTQCHQLVTQLHHAFGPIHALINNAGMTLDKLFIHYTQTEMDRILSTNLRGTINLSLAAQSSLKQSARLAGYAHIVNLSSSSALSGKAGQVPYSCAKGGILGFTRLCARLLSKHHIYVNAVSPGYIDTDMTRKVPKHTYQHILDANAISNIGQPQDVAALVCDLVRRPQPYSTGQVYRVDGGKFC